MSKKLKDNKKTEKKENIAELKEKILNGKWDLDILKEMQQAFSTASKQKQREAFISFLNKKLNNQQLHELNSAIMENANELMPANDSAFLCRTTNNKIFQELLLLEAKHCGMKAKFAESELQPLNAKDIPQEILNHYSVLKENFYLKRASKDSIDSKIAQSINFLLYAPLFRETEIYKKLGLKVAEIEHEIQNPDGKYIKNLKISDYNKVDANKPTKISKEDKKDEIITASITKLEESKKLAVKNRQREKIKRHISKFLEEATEETLAFKRMDLIDVIYQELRKNQSKWSKFINYLGIKSYEISGKNLEKIGKIISGKIKNFHFSTNHEVIQEQLKQISEELNKLNNPTLPSEVKKAVAVTKSKTKPPISKKPSHLKP